MKRLLLVVLVALMGVSAIHAQQETNPISYPTNTLTVVGSGTSYGAPDVAYIELGVEVIDPELGTAFTQTAEQMAAVTQALLDAGIAQEDIQTTSVNIYPEDRYNPQDPAAPSERVYHVRNTVQVVVRDISQIESIITTAVDAGANNIYNFSFGVADAAALEAQARTQAVANARERAQQLADAVGVTLGQPVVISESIGSVNPPQPFASGGRVAMMDASQPISTGQLSVTVQVQVSFSIQNP